MPRILLEDSLYYGRTSPPPWSGSEVTRDPATTVLDRLEQTGSQVRGRAGSWMAQCPAHHDRTPSLSIKEFRDGNVWINCFAGCEDERVLDKLGLAYRDLFVRPLHDGPNMVPGKPLPPEWKQEEKRLEFGVLGVLPEHAFNGPTCRPSQALIAAELRAKHGWHTTRESVNRACAWLREYKFIDWDQERAPGAKWRHNVYRLLCTWTRPLRRKLLRRLDSLRKGRNTYLSTLPVPFSVIHPEKRGEADCGESIFGRVLAQPARAGPG